MYYFLIVVCFAAGGWLCLFAEALFWGFDYLLAFYLRNLLCFVVLVVVFFCLRLHWFVGFGGCLMLLLFSDNIVVYCYLIICMLALCLLCFCVSLS